MWTDLSDISSSDGSENDSGYAQKPSTLAGNWRGKGSLCTEEKEKEASGGKQGRGGCLAKGKSSDASQNESKKYNEAKQESLI